MTICHLFGAGCAPPHSVRHSMNITCLPELVSLFYKREWKVISKRLSSSHPEGVDCGFQFWLATDENSFY